MLNDKTIVQLHHLSLLWENKITYRHHHDAARTDVIVVPDYLDDGVLDWPGTPDTAEDAKPFIDQLEQQGAAV